MSWTQTELAKLRVLTQMALCDMLEVERLIDREPEGPPRER